MALMVKGLHDLQQARFTSFNLQKVGWYSTTCLQLYDFDSYSRWSFKSPKQRSEMQMEG